MATGLHNPAQRMLGMVTPPHARSARIVLYGTMILSFLFAVWTALQPWIAERTSSQGPVDQAIRKALSLDPGNDRLQAKLASLYHYSLLLRDYPSAFMLYRSILRNNPLDSASWLHLGKLYEGLGELSEADQALSLATQLGQNNASLLWEIALAYLNQEQDQKALDTLARFLSVAHNPSDLARGYELAHTLRSPEEVLNTVIPPTVRQYTHYANYLLDRNLGDQALAAWNQLTELTTRIGEPIDTQLRLRVIDLFMTTGQIGPAYRLWTAVTKQATFDNIPTASNHVSNASFEEQATIGRGFDWRIGSAPGVTAALDSSTAYTGYRSLRLSFTRSRSDFVNASQIVPIQPNAIYVLEAHMKTEGFKGSPGIQLEVIDPSSGLLARTDPVLDARDWTTVGLRFQTVGESQSVTLRIHAEPPPAYMPPLSGSVWIDNVTVTKVE